MEGKFAVDLQQLHRAVHLRETLYCTQVYMGICIFSPQLADGVDRRRFLRDTDRQRKRVILLMRGRRSRSSTFDGKFSPVLNDLHLDQVFGIPLLIHFFVRYFSPSIREPLTGSLE